MDADNVTTMLQVCVNMCGLIALVTILLHEWSHISRLLIVHFAAAHRCTNTCHTRPHTSHTHTHTHTHTTPQELMNPISSRLVTPIPTPIKTRPFEFPATSQLATKIARSDKGGVSVNLSHSLFMNSKLSEERSDKPLDSTRHEPKRYTVLISLLYCV